MNLLALEFSSPRHGVAVVSVRNETVRVVGAAEDQPAAGGARPLTLVQRALEAAGLQRADLDALAVGLGPGSYTGIRRILALAQGWHLARGIPVFGVNSVEACAVVARQEGLRGSVVIVVDAQRGELYAALYELDEVGCREVIPLQIVSVAGARELAETHSAVIVGPEAPRWFAQGRVLFPTAAAVGMLAVGRSAVTAPEHLEPIYLRAARFVKASGVRPAPLPPPV